MASIEMRIRPVEKGTDVDQKKSQTVFDEVGYNISDKVKELILSLDKKADDVKAGADKRVEDLKGKIAKLEADVAEWKGKYEKLLEEQKEAPDVNPETEQPEETAPEE